MKITTAPGCCGSYESRESAGQSVHEIGVNNWTLCSGHHSKAMRRNVGFESEQKRCAETMEKLPMRPNRPIKNLETTGGGMNGMKSLAAPTIVLCALFPSFASFSTSN